MKKHPIRSLLLAFMMLSLIGGFGVWLRYRIPLPDSIENYRVLNGAVSGGLLRATEDGRAILPCMKVRNKEDLKLIQRFIRSLYPCFPDEDRIMAAAGLTSFRVLDGDCHYQIVLSYDTLSSLNPKDYRCCIVYVYHMETGECNELLYKSILSDENFDRMIDFCNQYDGKIVNLIL